MALSSAFRRQSTATSWVETSALNGYLAGTQSPFSSAPGVDAQRRGAVLAARARLSAQQAPGANSFLRPCRLPHLQPLQLNDAEWRVAVMHLLGLPVIPSSLAEHCSCAPERRSRRFSLRTGWHWAWCPAGGGTIIRHDKCGRAFLRLLKFLCPSLRFHREPHTVGRHRADVLIEGLGPVPRVLDFTISHGEVFASALQRRVVRSSQFTTLTAEKAKIRKHTSRDMPNTSFSPVALNSFGAVGPLTHKLLLEFAALLSTFTYKTPRALYGHLLSSLSVSVSKFTASTVLKRRASYFEHLADLRSGGVGHRRLSRRVAEDTFHPDGGFPFVASSSSGYEAPFAFLRRVLASVAAPATPVVPVVSAPAAEPTASSDLPVSLPGPGSDASGGSAGASGLGTVVSSASS